MASNTIFSKKNLPETKISFKSHLHKTIIISDFKSFNEEENRILYTINFSDEAIENSQIFQVDVGIPQEYTLNESIILIVGVLNKALKPFHRKLNPSAQYQFFQAKKNGKPKLDLPSLDGERIILECGVSTFCFTFKQKKENDIINLKKNSDVSARIASKTYQLPIKKQINDNGKTTKNKEEYESKKSFFNFCSCN